VTSDQFQSSPAVTVSVLEVSSSVPDPVILIDVFPLAPFFLNINVYAVALSVAIKTAAFFNTAAFLIRTFALASVVFNAVASPSKAI
jgi:hypothetical protein